MRGLSSVCVFCGSNAGADPAYAVAAESVGAGLAERGIRVVYGGTRVGLMGALADAACYFEPLAAFLDRAVAQRFLRPDTRGMLAVDGSFEGLMDRFETWEPVRTRKWIDLDET